MTYTEQQSKATGELVELVASKIGANRVIHPETAISSCARLAGSLMFRSSSSKLNTFEPGTILLSEEANEKSQLLIETLVSYLSKTNLNPDQKKLGGAEEQRGQSPNLDTLESLTLLQSEALKICTQVGLSLEQAAHSAATATAFIVKECAPQIGVETGFNVAVFGFIEGCKTVPPSLEPFQKSTPWYKFW